MNNTTFIGDFSDVEKEKAAEKYQSMEEYLETETQKSDSAEVQDLLYPMLPIPPEMTTVIEKLNGGTQVVVTGVADPVKAIAYMHPEFAAAAKKHGIDLNKAPGHELEEMHKYFDQGSGLYLVNVDFQIARCEAFKLNIKAQRKIHKALKPKRRKLAKKSKQVPNKKVKGKKMRTKR